MVLSRAATAAQDAQGRAGADMPFHFDLEADGGVAGQGWQGRVQKLVWRNTRNNAQTVLEAQPVSLSVMPEGAVSACAWAPRA